MIIKRLKFANFRNLKDNEIFPDSGVNIICGDNAQGKTNMLEGIWMFNGVKSFRGSKDSELVTFEKTFSKLELDFFCEEREQTAKIDIINGRREAYLNGIKKSAPSQLIGKINSVVFSPEHLTLVKNGPAGRRKFLDSAICQLMPKYAVVFAKYNKILNQRNALLKDIPYHSELIDTLDIWDEKLAMAGGALIYERLKYIDILKKKAAEFHSGISENKEELKLKYSCGYKISKDSSQKEITDILFERLGKNRNEDLSFKYTNTGPHRDDIDIFINGIKARTFASQGQQRSAVLSLKLAEATIVDEINDEKPVILLDDVLSELDSSRQNYLINKIKGRQVFITCCENDAAKRLCEGKIFHVNNGAITEE